MEFSDVDRAALTAAIKRLEEPGFAGKMTTLAGRPAELVARALPRRAASIVAKAAEAALLARTTIHVRILGRVAACSRAEYR